MDNDAIVVIIRLVTHLIREVLAFFPFEPTLEVYDTNDFIGDIVVGVAVGIPAFVALLGVIYLGQVTWAFCKRRLAR